MRIKKYHKDAETTKSRHNRIKIYGSMSIKTRDAKTQNNQKKNQKSQKSDSSEQNHMRTRDNMISEAKYDNKDTENDSKTTTKSLKSIKRCKEALIMYKRALIYSTDSNDAPAFSFYDFTAVHQLSLDRLELTDLKFHCTSPYNDNKDFSVLNSQNAHT